MKFVTITLLFSNNSVTLDNHLGNKSDNFHSDNDNNQLKR